MTPPDPPSPMNWRFSPHRSTTEAQDAEITRTGSPARADACGAHAGYQARFVPSALQNELISPLRPPRGPHVIASGYGRG